MRLKHFRYFVGITVGLLLHTFSATGQQKQYAVYPLAFYNVENLFDTQRDTTVMDFEFTPEGGLNWTPDKYRKKLTRLSTVLSRIGRQHGSAGPALIGVCEVENRKVLEDLVSQDAVKGMNLQIVHYDSPDRRGIDVALLYNPDLFRFVEAKVLPYHLPERPDYVTRDILMVKGVIANEMVHVFVNHWPSRFGGKSSILREHAASVLRHAVDSIYSSRPEAKIVIMGDFNDDPVDKSIQEVLQAEGKRERVTEQGLYNTMYRHYKRGVGSLGYLAKWNLFDQIIISKPLLSNNSGKLQFWKSEIYNPDYLTTKEGRYKGYPFRTFSSNLFQDGYSDHFPVLIYLLKELE